MPKYDIGYEIAGIKYKATVKATNGKKARIALQESLKVTEVTEQDEYELFRRLEKETGLTIMN